MLTRDDMVIIDLQGRQVAGSRKVTSEIGMHLAVYNQRPDVRAVNPLPSSYRYCVCLRRARSRQTPLL